jgi:hypothetical protein
LLTIALPAYTLIFLTASYYAGLYDKQQKRGRLIRSTLIAMITVLAISSLLPETWRFSRAILLLGVLTVFYTDEYRSMGVEKTQLDGDEEEEEKWEPSLQAGRKNIKRRINDGMGHKEERILGRVGFESSDQHCLTTIDNLPLFFPRYPGAGNHFLPGDTKFESIIGYTKLLPTESG